MSMSKVIFVNYDDRTSWLHGSPKHSVQEYDDGDVFVDDDVDYGEGDGDGDGYYLQAWTRLGSRGRQRDSTAQPTPPQCCSSESNWGWPKIISIWSGPKVMIMAMMTWPGKTNGALGLILCSRDVVQSDCASTSKMKSFILSLLFSLQKVCNCAQPTTTARPCSKVRSNSLEKEKDRQSSGQGPTMTDHINHSSI